jgi:hypothetical protein
MSFDPAISEWGNPPMILGKSGAPSARGVNSEIVNGEWKFPFTIDHSPFTRLRRAWFPSIAIRYLILNR